MQGQAKYILEHSITINRRVTFFDISLIVPSFFHLLLPLLMFFLSAENGDRMAVGTTMWGSQIVFLLIITGTIPGGSDRMSLLELSSILVLIFISLSIALTVLSTKCRSIETCPAWLRKILLKLMTSSASIRNCKKTEFVDDECSTNSTPGSDEISAVCDHMCFGVQVIALVTMLVGILIYYC